ncbi:SMI1/KNR4 family protein [Fischerella thermalis CCMEE 5273]|nr:SMI1/KNR4 family protein [Fischerella thermalis CCMEE 5273]
MIDDKNRLYNKIIKGLDLKTPARREEIIEAEKCLGIRFPKEYVDFMLLSNGAEGPVGNHAYLRIWPVEELMPANEGYSVEEFIPGIILFGSDGSGEAYGFDSRDNEEISIISIPFMDMDFDEMEKISNSFKDFLKYLYQS